MTQPRILISAGEASGDLYAAALVESLRRRWPDADFYGCAGARMRQAGVRPVVEAEALAVVGLFEVVRHVPRIWREYRKMVAAARRSRPDVAVLTDSPDFHLRLARRLRGQGTPVVYLVAPQAWAWRRGRVRAIRRDVERLLCIFPFEEAFFRGHGIEATYIGHPLARLIRPSLDRPAFFRRHGLAEERPLVTLLPGSRTGEAARHMPALLDAAARLHRECAANLVLALPAHGNSAAAIFREPISRSPIQVIEGETWDAISHADLALAASGTVTVEAALLGTPVVAFYKVTGLSWYLGRPLVKVPFYSMVNLVAGRRIVPEIMQREVTGERLAGEARRILDSPEVRSRMKQDLAEVAARLSGGVDPMETASSVIQDLLARRRPEESTVQ